MITASLRPRRVLSACAGSLALAALPKCPLCLLAWAGVAGSTGFASAYGAWLLPATALALAVTVGALALAGAGAGPLLLALAGAAAALGGKFRLDQPALLYAGLAALLAATAWGVLHRKPPPAHACPTGACAAASSATPSSIPLNAGRPGLMPRPTIPALSLAAAALLAAPAAAQNAPAAPGCAYEPIDIETYGKKPFRNPPEIRSANGRLHTSLVVRYTNPDSASLGGCPLTIRSYNGALVGPTLRVKPGDVMVPWLDNRLPVESDSLVEAQFQQEASVAFLDMRPYSFNTTNLHTHGLHVSPSGNSDNVLLAISPQTRFQYRIALPGDHTRGTYWYHAHAHGSTAVQVGSAMAGALVVDDDPARIPAALRAANEREKVMVIQTILYDVTGKSEDITAFFPDPGSGRNQACVTGATSCTWLGSNRHVTINGQIVPVIHMAPGEVQRWRMVDGSFRETMAIRLEGHALHEIATDGIYTGRIDTWPDGQEILLYPGYRSDVLVQAGAPGTYRLLDDSAGVGQSLKGVAEDQNLLALVIVEDVPRMDMRLPTQAEMAALDPFPGVNLAARATGVQEAVFKLGSGLPPTDPRNSFQINYSAFNESRKRYLQLDSIDMWSLTTVGDPAAVQNGNGVPPLPHVFHIHINPFQVFRSGPNGQPQMVWKDTQFIPAGETVNVYTQYLDYTGSFVIHCHILDHEDLGMMETVEVVREMPRPHPRPDTSSGSAAHGHGSH